MIKKAQSVAPAWGTSLPGIEGLRGAAAASVLVAHAGAEMGHRTTEGGAWSALLSLRHGLTLFFVLSGFLLFRQFAASILSDKPAPAYGRFLSNRLWRIFPAWIVVLLITSFVLQVGRLSSSSPDAKAEASGVLGFADTLWSLLLLQNLNPEYVRTGLGVAWSLTTELTFYLVLPLLAALAALVGRRTRPLIGIWVAPGLLLISGLACKWVDYRTTSSMTAEEIYDWRWGHEWSAVFARSIFMHGDLFAIGMLAAIFYTLMEVRRTQTTARHPLILMASAFLLLALVELLTRSWGTTAYNDSIVAVAASLVIVASCLPTSNGRNLVGRTLDLPVFTWAGKVSYSVYLWHIPWMWFLLKHDWARADTSAGLILNVGLVVVLTYTTAALTYRFVERPGLAMKRRTDRQRQRQTA